MTWTDFDSSFATNPLDVIEHVASTQNWAFDRTGEHELDLAISGAWGDYAVSINWRDDVEALHLAAEMDLRAPREKRGPLVDLMAQINEKMFLGHFDLWAEEGIILFRNGLLLRGCMQVSSSQCEDLLTMAISACDRFYPAFQYVIWAGKTPQDALSAALFETEGRA